VLENGKRQALRIWLATPVLFEPGAGGVEQLTADGRARVDSAIATFLRYLPSSPLVVEGNATEGTDHERYRLARQRAEAVREYLLARYGLLPQHTGFIALGAEAPGSPNGNRWDGVALALFAEAETLQFETQRRNISPSQPPGERVAR
jgi:OmpA family